MLAYCFLLGLVTVAKIKGIREACDGCKAYECYEDEIHCGQRGYLLGYGEKYCLRFESPEIVNRFTEKGQSFLNCTSPCLINFLGKYLKTSANRTCTDVTSAAFGSHVTCYLKCGFCSICKENKVALFASYDFRDFFSNIALKQIFQVMRRCGGPFACW